MDIPVFFPNLKKGSTKDCIIQLLTKNDSMTNQRIFNAIKKQYALSRSYQTVRQALMELVEDGVLKKDGRFYSISTNWITTIDNYVDLLKKKFIEKKDIKIIDENTKEINLTSLYDLGHFILYSFRDHFFNEEKKLYMYIRHLWIPFADGKKRDMLRNFFSRSTNYFYVSKSSVGDKILANFYRKYGKVKFNVKLDSFFDFIIQGDCIAKIYMPKELRSRMDKAYSFKNLSFDFFKKIEEMTYSDYSIKILILRDKKMVEEIKSQLRI